MLIACPPALIAYTSEALFGIAPELELDEELLEEEEELLEDEELLFEDEDELLELLELLEEELLVDGAAPHPTSPARTTAGAMINNDNLGIFIIWTPKKVFLTCKACMPLTLYLINCGVLKLNCTTLTLIYSATLALLKTQLGTFKTTQASFHDTGSPFQPHSERQPMNKKHTTKVKK